MLWPLLCLVICFQAVDGHCVCVLYHALHWHLAVSIQALTFSLVVFNQWEFFLSVDTWWPWNVVMCYSCMEMWKVIVMYVIMEKGWKSNWIRAALCHLWPFYPKFILHWQCHYVTYMTCIVKFIHNLVGKSSLTSLAPLFFVTFSGIPLAAMLVFFAKHCHH